MFTTIAILILALLGVIYSADKLVDGSTNIARRFNISEFVIGALIVGVGTSLPELVVSAIGAIQNNSDIAIGNVVGSNIFNILGILGLTSIIFPISIKTENIKFDIPVCLIVSIIVILMMPVINFIDGIVLLICFILFTILSLKNTNTVQVICSNENILMSVLKVIFGLFLLIICCDIFVDKSIIIAKQFGLSDAVISLTILACGTSMPEFASSLVAAFKKNTQLALGNIIGSNIFNITFILGVCSQITDLTTSNIGLVDYSMMLFAVIALIVCSLFKKINKFAGVIMLASFIAYTIYLIN